MAEPDNGVDEEVTIRPGKPLLSEKSLLLLLAAVQFTHIMDFMIMMPLGPQLMRELNITAQQFGGLISSFALTAGIVVLN